MTTPDASATAASAPKSASVWEDFVDVLYAPSAVFERRRDGRFGLALVVLTVVFAAAYFAAKPLTEPLLDRALEQTIEGMRAQGLSEQQIASSRPTVERFSQIAANVMGVIGMPLLVTFGAVIAWLTGKLFGSRASFSQMMMVGTYANVPRVLGVIVGAVVLASIDASQLPPLQQMTVGPALLLDREASPLLAALLVRLDVFGLWTAALYAIGIATAGRISRQAGFGAAAVGFLIATLFALFGVLQQAQ